MRDSAYLIGVVFMVACAADASDPKTVTVNLPPNGGIPTVNHVPAGAGHALMFGGGSSFTFIGPTAPGTASWTNAPVFDPSTGGTPGSPGDGAMNITINGTSYAAPSIQSIALTLTDPNGTAYVALDGYATYPGPGGVDYANEVTVIVLASDFTPGAVVALDGNDRVALFANGPADAMDPTLVGAAISGTLTFTGGDLGTMLSGTVAGDFGQINYVPDPPPNGSITAGAYTLVVAGPAQVYCDGALVGHEADFAGVTQADLGIGGGAVTVTTPSATEVDIAGASGFGGSFALDAMDSPPGLFAGFTNESGSGPDGTTFVGKYLALDGGSATPTLVDGSMGGGYASADGQSTCTVAFGASLTSP